jgi:hypothetical protein
MFAVPIGHRADLSPVTERTLKFRDLVASA